MKNDWNSLKKKMINNILIITPIHDKYCYDYIYNLLVSNYLKEEQKYIKQIKQDSEIMDLDKIIKDYNPNFIILSGNLLYRRLYEDDKFFNERGHIKIYKSVPVLITYDNLYLDIINKYCNTSNIESIMNTIKNDIYTALYYINSENTNDKKRVE